MKQPVCLSPLKFYKTVAEQERYKSYAYGHIQPLLVHQGSLPAFQFFDTDLSAVSSISAKLFRADDNTEEASITINASDWSFGTDGTLVFYGKVGLTARLGCFYVRLTVSTSASSYRYYYSEILCYAEDLSECIKIEYSNPECNFEIAGGTINFDNNFKFVMYLATQLGKPEYQFEDEVTKRLGYQFIESLISKKVYKFNAIMPEYQCDALRLVHLCSNKTLTYKNDMYQMLTFDMDVDWQDQGDLASVTCEFEVDNVIVNLGGFNS